MTFTAVVVSHANARGLRSMLGNLIYQTRKPDEIIVVCSDTDDLARLREDFPDVKFVEDENRRDWGHAKRSLGLSLAASEWVGWFNDDDRYELDYLETMLDEADGLVDVVYCAWNEQPGCDFRLTHSTAGNFVVRTELARTVGYPGTPVYENDGHFIERLNDACARVVKVEEVLYHHNAQA